ncbi:hypothetical protein BGLT_01611 [Caballeronia glathei]|nr:hypothetical protein BGLT_01611 [Caballeronia glathei]
MLAPENAYPGAVAWISSMPPACIGSIMRNLGLLQEMRAKSTSSLRGSKRRASHRQNTSARRRALARARGTVPDRRAAIRPIAQGVKSHARSLLSIARLNIAHSRALDDICSLVLIAQISRSFNGGFWPVNLPLFHGTRREPEELSVSMTTSSSTKGDRFCAWWSGQSSTRSCPSVSFCECHHRAKAAVQPTPPGRMQLEAADSCSLTHWTTSRPS